MRGGRYHSPPWPTGSCRRPGNAPPARQRGRRPAVDGAMAGRSPRGRPPLAPPAPATRPLRLTRALTKSEGHPMWNWPARRPRSSHALRRPAPRGGLPTPAAKPPRALPAAGWSARAPGTGIDTPTSRSITPTYRNPNAPCAILANSSITDGRHRHATHGVRAPAGRPTRRVDGWAPSRGRFQRMRRTMMRRRTIPWAAPPRRRPPSGCGA
jgi:hypothetical protein